MMAATGAVTPLEGIFGAYVMVLLQGKPQIWVSRVGRWRRVALFFPCGASFRSRYWLALILK
jgi:hypothetical protein